MTAVICSFEDTSGMIDSELLFIFNAPLTGGKLAVPQLNMMLDQRARLRCSRNAGDDSSSP